VTTPTSPALPVLAAEVRPGAKPLLAIGALADVPVRIEAPLGCVDTDVREVLALAPGSVVMLDRLTGESIPVTANGMLIARGEVRVHGDRFAVRVTEILGCGVGARSRGVEPHAKASKAP